MARPILSWIEKAWDLCNVTQHFSVTRLESQALHLTLSLSSTFSGSRGCLDFSVLQTHIWSNDNLRAPVISRRYWEMSQDASPYEGGRE